MTEYASKKAIWGWMMYDWAAQPFHTLLVTFIFAPYFASVVIGDPVQGQAIWGFMMGAVSLFIALLAPILGAFADATGPRKPWIMVFALCHILGAMLLWIAVPGMENYTVALLAFALGFIGVEFTQIFINAMLPDLGPTKDLGRISGTGWGLGYLGGLLALIFTLLFLAENNQGVTLLGNPPLFGLDPATREGTRAAGPLAAVWMILFILPFIFWTPDTPKKQRVENAVHRAMVDLWQTIKTLPQSKSLFSYLMSSMFYRDALNGLYTFGGIYAAGVLGWTIVQVGIFGIIAAASGALFTWLGGYADQKYGPKKVIVCSVVALIIICVVTVGMSRESFFGFAIDPSSAFPDRMFFLCGAVIGAAGGILQSASRVLLVHQADPDNITKSFGLYALSGRATSFLAPTLVGLFTLVTGSQQLGILPVIGLFIIGLVLLKWVVPSEEYQ